MAHRGANPAQGGGRRGEVSARSLPRKVRGEDGVDLASAPSLLPHHHWHPPARQGMLPYDGEPVQAPSTSAWAWDDRYSLYFNSGTKQWARPRPDGGWDYAGGDDTAAATAPEQPNQPRDAHSHPAAANQDDDDDQPRADDRSSHRAQVSYDDVDQAPPAAAVPEEQLWPASDDDEPDPADRLASAPLLRLVVHRRPDPAVLPLAHTVASLDPAEPVSIGRDKSFERRIRLRELAVSKTHCTLFWAPHADPDAAHDDADGSYWAVVDNASTHGTFVADERGENEVRLSDPKVASTPRRLHHLECVPLSLVLVLSRDAL